MDGNIREYISNKIQDIKIFAYNNNIIIYSIIVFLCICGLIYTINTGNKPKSDGVEESIRDAREQVQSVSTFLQTITVTADGIEESNREIQGYNTAIQNSQRQTEENLVRAGESLQSAIDRTESINNRNKQSEQRLRDMQTVLNQLKEQQQQLDRVIREAESIDKGTRNSN